MDSDSARGIDRRRLFGWSGLAAAGVVAGVPLLGAQLGHADPTPTDPSGNDRIPPATLPGGPTTGTSRNWPPRASSPAW